MHDDVLRGPVDDRSATYSSDVSGGRGRGDSGVRGSKGGGGWWGALFGGGGVGQVVARKLFTCLPSYLIPSSGSSRGRLRWEV